MQGRLILLGLAAALAWPAWPAGARADGEGPDLPATRPAVELPAAARPGSAYDRLLADGRHRRFLELSARVGLIRALDGEHDLTVFAPDDAAFDALGEREMAGLLAAERRPELRELIAGHVLWGPTRSADVAGVSLKPTLPGFAVVLRVREGHEHGEACDHETSGAPPTFTVSDIAVDERDVIVSNGVVHRIASLIRPPERLASSPPRPRHAPACEDDPEHAKEHARMADLRQRQEQARRAAAGGRGGGQGDGVAGTVSAESAVELAPDGAGRPAPGSPGGVGNRPTPPPVPPNGGGGGAGCGCGG